MPHDQDLERFMKRFAGYVFPHCPTPKAARVSLAHIQGFIDTGLAQCGTLWWKGVWWCYSWWCKWHFGRV